MIRIIKTANPKIIVAENVKGILSLSGGKIFNQIQEDLKNLGYVVDFKILNSAYFGVPQFRERVIIVANKVGIKNSFPPETHGEQLKPLISVRDAIYHLANLELSYNPILYNNKIIYNHIASTNVHDKFWGRKHDVLQEDICDYLKE
jgi:DNA (cytosine-5)-methyltransferase 1